MIFLKNKKFNSGDRVIVRVDYNVDINSNDEIINDLRIKRSLETIDYLKNFDVKIILISHSSSDMKKISEKISLKNHLIPFEEDLEKVVEKVNESDEKVILLDNLRLWEGETTNDNEFADKVSKMGDYYVFDAFSVSHRKHATVTKLPKKLETFIGFAMEEELGRLKIATNEDNKILFLGGAKLSTKIPLLNKLADNFESIFLGGVTANLFLKEKGIEIGKSKIEDMTIDDDLLNNNKIILPKRVTIKRKEESLNIDVNSVQVDDSIHDVHYDFSKVIEPNFILWNGPFGLIEEGFREGTNTVLNYINETKSETIICGGNTIDDDLINNLSNEKTFLSTGGGAALYFLANGETEFEKALKNS